MDEKQHDRFQTAIQWVADEKARAMAGQPSRGFFHEQALWIRGVIGKAVRSKSGALYTEVCGTGGCVAGNIVCANGDTIIALDYQPYRGKTYTHACQCMDEDGNVHNISERAAALAGINEREAARLFFQHNSRGQIIRIAQDIAANHGRHLEVIE